MNFISRFIINRELNKKQEEINCEYNKNGFNNDILEKQVEINSIRHLFDIPDNNEKIYKKYVQ